MREIEYIWGIDPGSKGAVAFIKRDRSDVQVFRFIKHTEPQLTDIFFDWAMRGAQAYIEGVNSRPGEGISSAFTFGKNVGFARACLLCYRVPFDTVYPQVWQRRVALGKSYATKTLRKRAHLQKAQELFPHMKLTLEDADALLIAEYGWRTVFGKR